MHVNTSLPPFAKTKGFTLIEVMVALAIVAIALPALVLLVLAQIDGAAHVREKTYAMWIAENQLTRITLLNNKERFPNYKLAEKESGTVEMMGMQWQWKFDAKTAEEIPVPGFLKVEIGVAALGIAETGGAKPLVDADKIDPLARLEGYLSE